MVHRNNLHRGLRVRVLSEQNWSPGAGKRLRVCWKPLCLFRKPMIVFLQGLIVLHPPILRLSRSTVAVRGWVPFVSFANFVRNGRRSRFFLLFFIFLRNTKLSPWWETPPCVLEALVLFRKGMVVVNQSMIVLHPPVLTPFKVCGRRTGADLIFILVCVFFFGVTCISASSSCQVGVSHGPWRRYIRGSRVCKKRTTRYMYI